LLYSKAEDALLQAVQAIGLKRFGIGKDAEQGLGPLVRDPADTSPEEPARLSFEEPGHGGATQGIPYCELVIEQTETAVPKDEPLCAELGGPRLLKLSLVGREETDGAVQVLP
jgi:hypothetical protein